MILRMISAEWGKLHRSALWLAVVVLPVMSVVMGTFNYLQNTEVLQDNWYSLWTQVSLFYGYFFFPALIGIYAAYVCRLEHLNHNWNRVMTLPARASDIFLSKLAVIGVLTLLTQLLVGAMYLVTGTAIGFNWPFPSAFFFWMIQGWIGSLVIGTLQLCLSMQIRSFAAPVGIALVGGIGGLALGAKGWGLYFPYALLNMGMNSVKPTEAIPVSNLLGFGVSSAVFLTIFYLLGVWRLKVLDVKA